MAAQQEAPQGAQGEEHSDCPKSPLLLAGAALSSDRGAENGAPQHALEICSDHGDSSLHDAAPNGGGGHEEGGLLAAGAHKGSTHGALHPRKRLYMVTMFCLTASLLYADQNLMAPNLTAIAEDFGFDDEQRDKYLGGYIAAAFYMVGAPAALLFGYLSDSVNRRNLLFVAVLLGEGPCIMTYFVTQYWQLLVLRLLTGISLGGTFPLVFSLLGDLYEPSKRAAVAAVVQLSMGVGLAVGQGIAGFVGSSIGWRWPFVIVAVPSIVLALVMVLTTEEPQRGVTEQALHQTFEEAEGFVYSERINWRKLWHLLCIPTNVLAIMQGLFGCLPWGMLLTFLNDYLSQNKGLSVPAATAVILMIGIGGAVGVVGGGIVGQLLYNRNKRSMPIFIGTCTLLGTPPLWVLINAPVDRMTWLAFIMAFITGIMSSTVGPNLRAMMLNVNEPETRGMALALQTMLDDLGKGLGPALVAVLITNLGRTAAFNYSAAGWIPCGLLLLGAAFTLERDEAHMQQRLHHVVSQLLLSHPPSAARLAGVGQALDDAFGDSGSDEGGSRGASAPGRPGSALSTGLHSNGSVSGGGNGSGRLKSLGGGPSSLPLLGGRGGEEELQHRLLTVTAHTEEEGGGGILEQHQPLQQQRPPPG